jgi:hypothetical protein
MLKENLDGLANFGWAGGLAVVNIDITSRMASLVFIVTPLMVGETPLKELFAPGVVAAIC